MARFVAPPRVLGQPDLVSSDTAVHTLGTRAITTDGRVFRYVKAGEALVAGNCLQSAVHIPEHLGATAPVVAIGAKSFSFTPGNAAAAAGFYADGFLQVDTTPGNGYTYGVASHPAIVASTAFTLKLKDPIQVALTASSRLGLIGNPFRGVIQFPATTATGTLVGVATYVIASGEYGWVQTWGLCSTLTAGTPALGAMVMAPGAVAGAAEVVVAAGTLVVAQIVGHMAQVGEDGKNNFVNLAIHP